MRELRKRRGLSQRDLSRESGVSFSFIGAIETGRYNPSRETVRMLARGLKWDVNDFLMKAGFAPDAEMSEDERNLDGLERDMDTTPHDSLRKKYPMSIDGVEITEEEWEEAFTYIRARRIIKNKPD